MERRKIIIIGCMQTNKEEKKKQRKTELLRGNLMLVLKVWCARNWINTQKYTYKESHRMQCVSYTDESGLQSRDPDFIAR